MAVHQKVIVPTMVDLPTTKVTKTKTTKTTFTSVTPKVFTIAVGAVVIGVTFISFGKKEVVDFYQPNTNQHNQKHPMKHPTKTLMIIFMYICAAMGGQPLKIGYLEK